MTSSEIRAARSRLAGQLMPASLLVVMVVCAALGPETGRAAQAEPPGSPPRPTSAASKSTTASLAAARQQAALLATLRQAHPGTRFSEVANTQVPDLYEVWMNDTVAYVSARNPRFFIFGRLFDTQAMRDLTAPRLAQRAANGSPDPSGRAAVEERLPELADRAAGTNAADGMGGEHDGGLKDDAGASRQTRSSLAFERLPLADALRTVRGKGTRHLVVFSDPGCIYCKQLESELAALDDVTIHTFLVPFQGEARPIAVWCAADRAHAWRQWMLQGDAAALDFTAQCDHPIARNLALARRWDVHGTPTLFWADGTRTDGYVGREVLQARLSAASRTKPVTAGTADSPARSFPLAPAANRSEGQP